MANEDVEDIGLVAFFLVNRLYLRRPKVGCRIFILLPTILFLTNIT